MKIKFYIHLNDNLYCCLFNLFFVIHLERAFQSTNSDSEDNISDIDQNEELGSDLDEDEEVKNAVLTEDEVKLKTQVWMELNGDYLREMEGKYDFRS